LPQILYPILPNHHVRSLCCLFPGDHSSACTASTSFSGLIASYLPSSLACAHWRTHQKEITASPTQVSFGGVERGRLLKEASTVWSVDLQFGGRVLLQRAHWMRSFFEPRGIGVYLDGTSVVLPLSDTHGHAKALLGPSDSAGTTATWPQYFVWAYPRTELTLGYASRHSRSNLVHVSDDDSHEEFMRTRNSERQLCRILSQDPARNGAYWYANGKSVPTGFVGAPRASTVLAAAAPGISLILASAWRTNLAAFKDMSVLLGSASTLFNAIFATAGLVTASFISLPPIMARATKEGDAEMVGASQATLVASYLQPVLAQTTRAKGQERGGGPLEPLCRSTVPYNAPQGVSGRCFR
jgi:hypothetical protein